MVANLLRQPNDQWWDDADTDGVVEDRDTILAEAMRAARDELTRKISVSPTTVDLGPAAPPRPREPVARPERHRPGRGDLQPRPFEVGGGSAIVDATNWDATAGYDVTSAPSMRMVVDLDDLDRSRWVNLTGASGHVASSHYRDQTPLWVRGRDPAVAVRARGRPEGGRGPAGARAQRLGLEHAQPPWRRRIPVSVATALTGRSWSSRGTESRTSSELSSTQTNVPTGIRPSTRS